MQYSSKYIRFSGTCSVMMRNLNIQILSTFRSVKMHAGSNNGILPPILTFFTFLTWNSAACLWGGGRWWWSSSRLRWSWGSAGIAAEGLTVTQRWPGRPLSEPWTLSFHPLRQWSGTDTHSQRLAAVPLRSLGSCAELPFSPSLWPHDWLPPPQP